MRGVDGSLVIAVVYDRIYKNYACSLYIRNYCHFCCTSLSNCIPSVVQLLLFTNYVLLYLCMYRINITTRELYHLEIWLLISMQYRDLVSVPEFFLSVHSTGMPIICLLFAYVLLLLPIVCLSFTYFDH